MPPPDSPPTLRFGEFALDIAAYQLRRDGRPVKLGRQPMDLLILLVERHGQLVTRADIVDAAVGARRLRGRRDGRQHRDQQGAPGAAGRAGRAARSWKRCRARAIASSPRSTARRPPAACRAACHTAGRRRRPGPRRDRASRPVRLAEGRRPSRVARDRRPAGRDLRSASSPSGAAAHHRAADRAWRSPCCPSSISVSDADRDYLAAGLTDETSASLARIDPAHLSGEGTHRSRTAAPPRRRRRSARSCRSTTSSRARSAPKAHASG